MISRSCASSLNRPDSQFHRLGMYLAAQYEPSASSGLHTAAGSQAPAWWTLRCRKKMYLDGSGQAAGYRTMMATLLASGEPLSTLKSMDGTFADLYQYILSATPPCWNLTAIDSSTQHRGEAVFNASCASCHGVHSGAAAHFPDQVISASSVGTDPIRSASFAPADAAWINSTWFGVNGQAPYAMTATGLVGVLDSTKRPARWQRTGSDSSDYDPSTVGWRYTTSNTSLGNATLEARRSFDTGLSGLANGGHTYADSLTDAQRSDLLEYLRSL